MNVKHARQVLGGRNVLQAGGQQLSTFGRFDDVVLLFVFIFALPFALQRSLEILILFIIILLLLFFGFVFVFVARTTQAIVRHGKLVLVRTQTQLFDGGGGDFLNVFGAEMKTRFRLTFQLGGSNSSQCNSIR